MSFDAAKEGKTCPKHEVIFCRKCGHADSTVKHPPNSRIKCRECLGRSTLSEIWERDYEFIKAFKDVKQHEKNLKEVHRQGQSGEVTKSRLARAKQRREGLQPTSKAIVVPEIRKFRQHYGRFDFMEWHRKLHDEVPVDAEDYKRLPRKLYFRTKPDDIRCEKEEKAKLAKIVGDLNNPHGPSIEISEEERSSLSSLYELYLKQTVE